MMNFGGKRRTQEAYARLAEQAGFHVEAVAKDEKSDFAVLELVLWRRPRGFSGRLERDGRSG